MRLLFIVTGRRGAVPYKQTHTTAQTASPKKRAVEGASPYKNATATQTASSKNGTSKPVPYKRTPTAKHPPAVILSVLSEMREKGFANQKTESPRRISRRSMFAQTRVFLWRLCIRNNSFVRGRLPVIVRRSRRHSALLHSSVLRRSCRFAASRLRKTSRATRAQDDQ